MPDAEVPDAEVPDAEVPAAQVPAAQVPAAQVPATDVVVRPMRPDDVEAAAMAGAEALVDLDRRYGDPVVEITPEVRPRVVLRVARLQASDPHGAFVAEQDGRVVGTALATRRGPLWFLSLLTVAPGRQGQGIGSRLLAAALRSAEGAGAGWLLSSRDPRALRRYALAGFAPEPAFAARGRVDRALLPAVPQVREGSFEDDRELVEAVATLQRGAGLGPDLDVLRDAGGHLLVVDGPDGRGFAVVLPGGVRPLGATTVPAAQALLWAGLAEAGRDGEEVALGTLTAAQQWAVDVTVQARLSFGVGDASCHRGRLGPFAPYLPNGAYG